MSAKAKERPILFSSPMVRALLSGAKTQTRRVLRVQPDHHWESLPGYRVGMSPMLIEGGLAVRAVHSIPAGGSKSPLRAVDLGEWVTCRQGAPGDRLWVKETWAKAGEQGDAVEYRADTPDPKAGKWRPSIFMPRWASRLTLEVTGVRVERLHAITEDDAKAEGVAREYGRDVPAAMGGAVEPWRDYEDPEHWVTSPRASFVSLWRSINGAESWAANPWVWVIEFRRVQP